MQELLSTPEAAELADVSLSTIYRWIQGGLLSYRYLDDGRQGVVKAELLKITQKGENEVLLQIFHQVAVSLSQAVALLPAVEEMFGRGWEDHMWFAPYWREVQVKALLQSEAHRDIRPYVRKRGRPRQIPDAAGVPVASVLGAIDGYKRDHPDAAAVSGAEIVRTLAPSLTPETREIITPQVLGLLLDIVNAGELVGAVDLNDAQATSIKLDE